MYQLRAALVAACLLTIVSCDGLTSENDIAKLSAPGVDPLAKAQGWRDPGWHRDPHLDAVLEIALDRSTAELAWRENVPDTLSAGSDDGPGVYGDLDEVDFDRQAVVVWSSGENSCPDWIVDLRTTDNGAVEVETETLSPDPPSDPNVVAVCYDIYYPYRVVVAVDRERLPALGTLPSEDIVGVPRGIVTVYPYDP